MEEPMENFLFNIPSIISTVTTTWFRTDPAYLDPGSGSVVLQIILAVLLGLGFIFRSALGKFVAFIKRLFKKKDS